jgi:anti-sigma regulatory factor (Ser/Thr protein kinase)
MVTHATETFERRLAGDPGELEALRTQLSRFLGRTGAAREAVDRTVLATHEVVANACIHPARGRGVRVVANAARGRIVIMVRDRGPWRTRLERRSGGGFGLEIARTMVDRLAVDRAPGGTTVVLETDLGAE